MDLRIGWVSMDWIILAQDREQWWGLVNNIPSGSKKCWEFVNI
jgi:hypothetical protein